MIKIIFTVMTLVVLPTLVADTSNEVFVDTDGDKVPDWEDYCPQTPTGKHVWTKAQVEKINGNRRWVGCAGGGVEDAKEGFEPPSRQSVFRRLEERKEEEEEERKKRAKEEQWKDLNSEMQLYGLHRDLDKELTELPAESRILFHTDVLLPANKNEVILAEEPSLAGTAQAVLKIFYEKKNSLMTIEKGTLCTIKDIPKAKYNERDREEVLLGYVWKYTRFAASITIQCLVKTENDIDESALSLELLQYGESLIGWPGPLMLYLSTVSLLEDIAPVRIYLPQDNAVGRSFIPSHISMDGLKIHLLKRAPNQFFLDLGKYFISRKKNFLASIAQDLKKLSVEGQDDPNAPAAASKKYIAQLVVTEMVYPLIKETESAYVQKVILPTYERLLSDYRKHIGVAGLYEIEINKTNAEIVVSLSAHALRAAITDTTDPVQKEQMQTFLAELGVWSARLKAVQRLKEDDVSAIYELFRQHEALITDLSEKESSLVFALILSNALGYLEAQQRAT